MAGWKALKQTDRQYVRGILQREIAILRGSHVAPAAPPPSDTDEAERRISVLAIAIDVLQKASPPEERP